MGGTLGVLRRVIFVYGERREHAERGFGLLLPFFVLFVVKMRSRLERDRISSFLYGAAVKALIAVADQRLHHILETVYQQADVDGSNVPPLHCISLSIPVALFRLGCLTRLARIYGPFRNKVMIILRSDHTSDWRTHICNLCCILLRTIVPLFGCYFTSPFTLTVLYPIVSVVPL